MSLISIPYHNEKLNIHIITAPGRCIDLKVHDDLRIDLRIPVGMQWSMVEQYVDRCRDRIIREYEKVLMRNHQALETTMELQEGILQYRNGMRLPFLGEMNLILRIVKVPDLYDTRIYADETEDGNVILTIKTDTDDQDFIRYCVMRYYKKNAIKVIRQKAGDFASKMKTSFQDIQIAGLVRGTNPGFPKMAYQNIEIVHQKTLWGSCSRKKNLKFDWKLLMLPAEVVDYVIVHELGHLKKMNHSPAFWREVEKVLPEYKECRSWLDRHGREYEIF